MDESGKPKMFSRRDFLKAATISTLGAPLVVEAATKAVDEAQVALTKSFENDGAHLFPIYEAHSTQKGAVPLPEGTSGLFLEYNIPSWSYEGKTYNLYNLPVEELVRVIKQRPVDANYLETAHRNHFPIAFGDIIRYEQETLPLIKSASEKDQKNSGWGSWLFWAAVSLKPEDESSPKKCHHCPAETS